MSPVTLTFPLDPWVSRWARFPSKLGASGSAELHLLSCAEGSLLLPGVHYLMTPEGGRPGISIRHGARAQVTWALRVCSSRGGRWSRPLPASLIPMRRHACDFITCTFVNSPFSSQIIHQVIIASSLSQEIPAQPPAGGDGRARSKASG